jgi:hypothetical protein
VYTSWDQLAALRLFAADVEQRDPWVVDAHHALGVHGAHLRELHEIVHRRRLRDVGWMPIR